MDEEDVAGLMAVMTDAALLDEDVWLGMFNSISTHPGVASVSVAVAWADTGLEAFKERFRGEVCITSNNLH